MFAKIKKRAVILAVLIVFSFISIVNAADPGYTAKEANYCNFRNVKVGMIGQNNLYRSQHPANGSHRSLSANKIAKLRGIQTVLNLSDTKASQNHLFKKYNISSTYYYRVLFDGGNVYTAGLSVYRRDAAYRVQVVKCLKFMAKRKGPYLVHCMVGRDRTGLVMLLLESLMGASYSYILDDYTKSFVNVNGYSKEKAREVAIKNTNKELYFITGKSKKTDWSKENLAGLTEAFLKKGGMTAGEITALKRNLSIPYAEDGELLSESRKLTNRNADVEGRTSCTARIRVGDSIRFHYKLETEDPGEAVQCINTNKSVIKVLSFSKNYLRVSGLEEGAGAIILRSKSDHTKRMTISIRVEKKR